MENLFDDQELLELVIIFFIVVTFKFDLLSDQGMKGLS